MVLGLSPMQISFYVFNNTNTASGASSEALLDFVCKLTQTVLKKSELSLVIVDDDTERLAKLDAQLWSFSAESFIPHALLSAPKNLTTESLSHNPDTHHGTLAAADSSDATNALLHDKDYLVELTAPVILSSELPIGFYGAVLNLAAKPLSLTSPTNTSDDHQSHTTEPHQAATPERVLEIIAPDEVSKQQGRDKYQHYKNQGFELTYYPVN